MQFKDYKSASAHQLMEWVEGRPWHNPFTPDGRYGEKPEDGECCPDFSCCVPDVLQPREKREEFARRHGLSF